MNTHLFDVRTLHHATHTRSHLQEHRYWNTHRYTDGVYTHYFQSLPNHRPRILFETDEEGRTHKQYLFTNIFITEQWKPRTKGTFLVTTTVPFYAKTNAIYSVPTIPTPPISVDRVVTDAPHPHGFHGPLATGGRIYVKGAPYEKRAPRFHQKGWFLILAFLPNSPIVHTGEFRTQRITRTRLSGSPMILKTHFFVTTEYARLRIEYQQVFHRSHPTEKHTAYFLESYTPPPPQRCVCAHCT
jgi:hypothetical protein